MVQFFKDTLATDGQQGSGITTWNVGRTLG